jgi:hypothetical protein
VWTDISATAPTTTYPGSVDLHSIRVDMNWSETKAILAWGDEAEAQKPLPLFVLFEKALAPRAAIMDNWNGRLLLCLLYPLQTHK